MDNLNPNIKVMEYAVRGPLVIRAGEIEKELEKVMDNNFIIYRNKPQLTFCIIRLYVLYRQLSDYHLYV